MTTPAATTPATVPARLMIRVLATYAILYGAVIILSLPRGLVGGPFIFVNILPGSPLSWGIPLLGIGVALWIASLLAHWWLKLVGFFLFAVWHFSFATCLFLAETRSYSGYAFGTNGGMPYGALGVAGLVMVLIKETRRGSIKSSPHLSAAPGAARPGLLEGTTPGLDFAATGAVRAGGASSGGSREVPATSESQWSLPLVWDSSILGSNSGVRSHDNRNIPSES